MTTDDQRREALEVAITRAGGIIAFARALGVTHQAVTSWRKKRRIPPQRAAAIEALYGVDRRYLIDPDLLAAVTSPAPDLDIL